MNQVVEESQHRAFLNAYYGVSRHFYDWTRKYYLAGRDTELDALRREPWSSLLEVGPGTGRNLRKLHAHRATARYFGIEASDEMLTHAQHKCPFAEIRHGFAETFDIVGRFDERPDRILFSYCLSMALDPKRAIDNALSSLAPGGEVVVVDFGQCEGLPKVLRIALNSWLARFHVRPLGLEQYLAWGANASSSHGSYVIRARFTNSDSRGSDS